MSRRARNRHDKRQPCMDADSDALSIKVSPDKNPVAWLVETDHGIMLWPYADKHEALSYCDEGEYPTPLYSHPA